MDELQKIRNIPTRITNAASRILGAKPPSEGDSNPGPSASDTEAADKYMSAAAPKKPTPTPAPVPGPPKPPKPKAAPKLPIYHKGTDYVPKTGKAVLKKGEAVLDTDTADEYRKAKGDMSKEHIRSAATKALGGKESKPKKEIASMHIKKAANGGHIITHHHTHPEAHPSEDHVTKGDDELAEHVMTHMGEPNDGEAEADAGNSGVPSEAGASSAPPTPAPQAGASAGAGAAVPGM